MLINKYFVEIYESLILIGLFFSHILRILILKFSWDLNNDI